MSVQWATWRQRTGRIPRPKCFTRWHCWLTNLGRTKLMRNRSRQPIYWSRFTALTPSTREFHTISFMLTTTRNWLQEVCLPQEPTLRLHLRRHMHCTCHRIYSRDSAYGKTPSLPTLRQGMRHTSRATREKSSTPWIIWCTPTCRVDGTETRLRSFTSLEICRSWISAISKLGTLLPRCRFAMRLSGANGPTLQASFLPPVLRPRLLQLRFGLVGSGSPGANALPRLAQKSINYGRSNWSFARQLTIIGPLRSIFWCARPWHGQPKRAVNRMKR